MQLLQKWDIQLNIESFAKGYGLLSFAKSISKNAPTVAKSMRNKYSQKLLDSGKITTTDAIKIASKREIQNIAEADGDLIGNKIADKIASVSKDMRWEWNRNTKRKIYFSRKKTTNY